MTDEVELYVAGDRYRGFQRVSVERGIDRLTGRFDITHADRWAGSASARPIRPGLPCEVLINGEPVITGWIDEAAPSYGRRQHEVRLSGRDRTADLVDCTGEGREWSERTLLEIVRDLCRPFDIPVDARIEPGDPFASEAEEDASASEVIDDLVRRRGALAYTDGRGRLVIDRAGTRRARTNLVLGENIEAARGRFDLRDRFSTYQVVGSRTGRSRDSAESQTQVMAEATDPMIDRHRPLRVQSEAAVDEASAREYARWEAAVRRGRSSEVVYTVLGWTDNGTPWQPNTVVAIQDSYMGIDGDRLITHLRMSLDQRNRPVTDLTVVPRSSFLPEPVAQEEEQGNAYENVALRGE